MAKNTSSRSTSARKSLSHARPENARARQEKKKVRRTIFKTDQWYETAAMSISIAGRSKGARSGTAVLIRAKDGAD
jgi:predicted ribosome quality control (RQC) complex YloA/Tae2 family protein